MTTGELRNRAVDGARLSADGTPLYYRCQSCGARWNPYLQRHRRNATAQVQVDVWPAASLRTPSQAWQTTPIRLTVDGIPADLILDPDPREQVAATDLWASLTGGSRMFILTAWNPHGRPATLARNRWSHQALVREVHTRGWAPVRAVPFQSDVGWAEESLAIMGVGEAEVAELAAAFGQPAYAEWSWQGMRVRSQHAEPGKPRLPKEGHLVDGPWVGVGLRPVTQTCTMRSMGDRGSDSGPCRNPGGGWTSASRSESLRWSAQRRLFRETLGCETCGSTITGGRADTDGVVGVETMTVSSRYGPARPIADIPSSEVTSGTA